MLFPAFAQQEFKNGFIVDASNKYVYGYIAFTNTPHENCIFKEQQEGNPVEYNTGQIQGYGIINGEHFRKRPIEKDGITEDVFMKAVSDGRPVVLYTAFDRMFIERGNSFYELKNEQTYRNTLMSLLGDCGNFSVRAKKMTVSISTVKVLVEDYNECAASGGTSTVRSKSLNEFGVFAGLDRANFSISGFAVAIVAQKNFTDRTFVSGGFHYKLTPKWSSNVSLVSGMWFNDQRLYVSGSTTLSGVPRTQIFRVNYKVLRLPILLEAGNFVSSKLQPYFKGGLSFPFMLKKSANISRVDDKDDIVYIDQYNAAEDFKEPVFLHLMGGFTFPLSNRLHIFCEGHYARGKNKFTVNEPQPGPVTGKFRNTGVNVGLVIRSH